MGLIEEEEKEEEIEIIRVVIFQLNPSQEGPRSEINPNRVLWLRLLNSLWRFVTFFAFFPKNKSFSIFLGNIKNI